ncbi:uncharacterized protein [Physcomitrium patens]|uniref:uncharacterized protein n=1 Tax=Physcomitrium patens TaxID=3218 RepID=UPI003CCE3906
MSNSVPSWLLGCLECCCDSTYVIGVGFYEASRNVAYAILRSKQSDIIQMFSRSCQDSVIEVLHFPIVDIHILHAIRLLELEGLEELPICEEQSSACSSTPRRDLRSNLDLMHVVRSWKHVTTPTSVLEFSNFGFRKCSEPSRLQVVIAQNCELRGLCCSSGSCHLCTRFSVCLATYAVSVSFFEEKVPRVKEGSQSVELAPHCVVKEVKSKIASWKILSQCTQHCADIRLRLRRTYQKRSSLPRISGICSHAIHAYVTSPSDELSYLQVTLKGHGNVSRRKQRSSPGRLGALQNL